MQYNWCPERKTEETEAHRENILWWQKQILECCSFKPSSTKDDGHHQKLGRGKEGFYVESQREHGPANSLVLEF